MEYSGKKLPVGFIYMLNKKDMVEIESIIGYSIDSVYLDGTSYSETKMAKYAFDKSKNTHFSVVYINYIKEEEGLRIKVELYGIRKSHFLNESSLLSQKEKVKSETIEHIRRAVLVYKNHVLDSNYVFVSLYLE